MASLLSGGKAEEASKQGLVLPDSAVPSFPGIPPTAHAHLSKEPLSQPHEALRNTVSTSQACCCRTLCCVVQQIHSLQLEVSSFSCWHKELDAVFTTISIKLLLLRLLWKKQNILCVIYKGAFTSIFLLCFVLLSPVSHLFL